VKLMAQTTTYSEDAPSPSQKKKTSQRSESSSKLQQVLDYSSSVDKVSNLLGVDAPKVYEIYKEQAEGQIRKGYLKDKPRNKRNSQKALLMLGHDLSKEKVKKTLGLDEEAVLQMEEDITREQEIRFEAQRKAEGSPHKKHCVKALNTLGLDPSARKATKLLGVDEETLNGIQHEEREIQEEKLLVQRRRDDQLALNDRRHNRKAHHLVGYDPSLEKVLDTLGVAGTIAEAEVEATILPSARRAERKPAAPQSHWTTTAAVYALSAIVLVSALASRYG